MKQKNQLDGKLVYVIPQLLRYGRVEELTQAKYNPDKDAKKDPPGNRDKYGSRI